MFRRFEPRPVDSPREVLPEPSPGCHLERTADPSSNSEPNLDPRPVSVNRRSLIVVCCIQNQLIRDRSHSRPMEQLGCDDSACSTGQSDADDDSVDISLQPIR